MRHYPLRPLSLAIALLLPLAALGCVHLHSPANQKVAEKAQAEFQDAKIGEAMNEERGRQTDLLKQELAAVRRLTLAHRDASVVKIIAGEDATTSWIAWKADIKLRFKTLLGSPEADYGPLTGELAGAQFAFTSARDALARDRRQYAGAPGPLDRPQLPACALEAPPVPASAASPPAASAPQAVSPPADPVLKAIWDDYQTECTAYRAAYKRLRDRGKTNLNAGASSTSTIGQFLETLERAEFEVESARAQALDARKKYQDQLKALKSAAAAGTSASSSALGDLVAALQQLREVPIFGPQEALSAQLDSVVALLDNQAKGGGTQTAVEEGNQKVAETVQVLSQTLQKAGEKPKTASLVLTAEHLRLELERATRQVSFTEARLNLLHQQGVAFVTELTLLRQALTAVEGGPNPDPSKDCSQTKAFAQSYEVDYANKPTCRNRVVAALLRYADSWTVGRLREEEIRYLLISLDHGAALDSSEIALLQWQNLVAVPLGELVTFHRSGITTEEIGQLLQVLGLAGIAARF